MEQLLVYRNMDNGHLVYDMMELMEVSSEASPEHAFGELFLGEEEKEMYLGCVHRMIELAEQYGLQGNLWHCCLALLLANSENAFSRACEKVGKPDGSICFLAMNDFERLQKLFTFDWSVLDDFFDLNLAPVLENYDNANKNGHVFNTRVRDRICLLAKELEQAQNPQEFFDCVTCFYREFGVGKLGLHKAFRIVRDEKDEPFIQPITCTEHVYLDQLVGYERQKKKLIDNTKNFVDGKEANNVLLFGDAGTGKSSCIKGIMNEFYAQGLRLIEVYKHQFSDLPKIIAQIKNRNYKFIIYMDDLSFEEFEIEYKYLKAVIEGGLENKPDNVLIYATSNRRHLIKESFNDTKDYNQELHSSDTVQEKLSLVARFGVTIYFSAPDKMEYDEIVRTLAKRAGIEMDEDKLLLEANKWELNHGGRSGRCAQQFIVWLKGQQ
ncbi:MAG: ATP-binding protein [Lachnospiraceae bacterium]|nr:ATP-binding protein [Lachnospiraceae bacterium]